jgi:hypothetical protein
VPKETDIAGDSTDNGAAMQDVQIEYVNMDDSIVAPGRVRFWQTKHLII